MKNKERKKSDRLLPIDYRQYTNITRIKKGDNYSYRLLVFGTNGRTRTGTA